MIAQTAAPASALRAHEELFAYWASRRSGKGLPSRRDIEPDGFKRHLPTVSLIDVRRRPLQFRMRLAGTGLYGVYGREITGLDLEQIYSTEQAEYWRAQLTGVVDGRRPAVGSCSLAWRGASRLTVLWLRLPLASDGRNVDMILGYDAVIGLKEDRPTGIRAA
jgi:hypothetical protein